MPIKVKVSPTLKEVSLDYKRRAENLGDFRLPYKKASIFFDQWVQRNIKAEGAGLGPDSWAPFKYGGRVNVDGKGVPIQVQVPWGVLDAFVDTTAKLLQKTGRLRLSMLPFANDKEAGIGSHLPYSKAHEEGLGVPERRILPTQAEVHDDVEKILHAHGMKALKGKK